MLNRVFCFEIPSDDTGKSMKFFKDVFGGWIAYLKDPDGNIHGICQEDRDVK